MKENLLCVVLAIAVFLWAPSGIFSVLWWFGIAYWLYRLVLWVAPTSGMKVKQEKEMLR